MVTSYIKSLNPSETFELDDMHTGLGVSLRHHLPPKVSCVSGTSPAYKHQSRKIIVTEGRTTVRSDAATDAGLPRCHAITQSQKVAAAPNIDRGMAAHPTHPLPEPSSPPCRPLVPGCSAQLPVYARARHSVTSR